MRLDNERRDRDVEDPQRAESRDGSLVLDEGPRSQVVAPSEKRPFEFWGCTEIRESLNIRAHDERDLLECLETVPSDSIYFHSVRSLLRRRVVRVPYSNDFAEWVATEMRDPILAERLAFLSPFDFPDVEAFRQELVTNLDDHLTRLLFTPRAIFEKPFQFRRGHLVAVPLGVLAEDLHGFRSGLAEIDESSVYYHAVESVGRGGPGGDFTAWLGETLGLDRLAQRVRQVDPFVATLELLRRNLLTAIDDEIGETNRENET
jgi:hypothetical protein